MNFFKLIKTYIFGQNVKKRYIINRINFGKTNSIIKNIYLHNFKKHKNEEIIYLSLLGWIN